MVVTILTVTHYDEYRPIVATLATVTYYDIVAN